MRPRPRTALFCFLKKLSGVRKLTTFYFAKNDHRWVTFISLKTINSDLKQEGETGGRDVHDQPTGKEAHAGGR